MGSQSVRPAAVAGSWYPARPDALTREIDRHLAAATPPPAGDLIALVAPHAGLMYSGPVAAYAYRALETRHFDAAVLVGPSHFVGFDGVAVVPHGGFETPLGVVPIAEDLAGLVAEACPLVRPHPSAHAREHSLELQLPFLRRLQPDLAIVPLLMGLQTPDTIVELGTALGRVLRDRRVLLVASTDLSHYHDARTAAMMDYRVIDLIAAFDPEGLLAALEKCPEHACGGGPTVSVMLAARSLGAREALVLKYADSGDVSGDKNAVVGYVSAMLGTFEREAA